MKKILIPIGILVVGTVKSQLTPLPATENYIQTKTYLDYNGTQVTKSAETVQYFDGLGRPKQVVNVKASPLGRDIVTPIVYDNFGRQTRDYLPIPQSGTQNGSIYPQTSGMVNFPVSDATGIYTGEKIYSEKVLENSPLDRIQQQIQVGNAWSTKPAKFEYGANIGNDVYHFVTTTIWENGATKSSLSIAPAYTANQLYRNAVIDEDENKTYEYKNGSGQVLLVRKMLSDSEYADTYYVYNEYDQLAFVIPPNAVNQTITETLLNDLCYQYRYDGRGRLVEKRLPGKGWESMIYDKQDRLVATQDAELKIKGQWLYTKYDSFGRVAITGIGTGDDRIAEQNILNTYDSNNVNRVSVAPFARQGMDVYYGNQDITYPNSTKWVTILSLNYYDSYPAYGFNPAPPANTPEMTVLTATPTSDGRSTKGLPLMNFVKNIEDDNWTKNYTYYDQKARVIGTHSINHLGGFTRTESELNFMGVPKKTITIHTRKSTETGIMVTERFEYDHQNRLLAHRHQVDDKPEQILTENTYNELSQLKNKKVGNNLQSIDYAYNIRGWLTDINKDQMNVTDLGGKLFSYKIKYNQMDGITNPDASLFSGKNVKPKYNGNIAEIDWRAVESLGANPPLQPKRYGYVYDPLNRLTAGYYQNPVNAYTKEHTESLSYDMNGNITNLYRTSSLDGNNTTATVIDELEYIYTKGNQASIIKDHKNNPSGYEGGGGTIEYNLNGSMWKMPDKNIANIQYNHLNLPNRTEYGTFGLEGLHTILYGADGTKLQKLVSKFECGFASCYSVNDTSDYLDGFQYFRSETINSGGGGGPIEGRRMTSEKLNYAYEQQAYTIENKTTDPSLGIVNTTTVKTPDLRFFPTAEGFYDYVKDQYIYQYKDHLGNARISFGRNSAGALEITDSNDYYPFGMNHLRTGNSIFGRGIYQNYKYQGQELQESGFYSFKWRNYMPDVGRFFNIDPLAEKFPYNSTYAFAENRVIDGRELEGLEWVSSRNLENKTVNLHLTYKPVNNTMGALSNAQMSALLQDREAQIVSSFGGKDSAGNQVNITFSQSDKSTMVWDYNIGYDTNNVDDFKGKSQEFIDNAVVRTDGMTDTNNNTQTNRTQINVYTTKGLGADDAGYVKSDNKGRSDVAKTGAHETGHTLGIKHNDKATLKSSPDNLMRDGGPGTKITPEQRTNAINLVEQQQPKTR
ncbi:DUF6443 domain-containing protein [Chryseobacterium lactis]|uniref:DUF6443 domain-containing protein n=2 Tax=Pseudomonadati TaxID=3379134 RepID=UPI00162816D3|nr:DUF6443 domain-containing protein [Chryseobacterium lactis]